jgi:threonyl-tRNA synthetase
MLKVNLPDGSSKDFAQPVNAKDVAAAIGPGLAKAALAAQVWGKDPKTGDEYDGKIISLDFPLPETGAVKLRIITQKDPEAIDVMRHSAAHVMARAVMRLWPGVQLAFGPTIEGGFYYDFELPHKLSEEDFPAIEAEMAKIIKLDEPFVRSVLPRAEALAVCDDMKQEFKVEHIGSGLADEKTLSFYRQGEFVDLCRGPHVPTPAPIKAYKILSVAGAYWKGDATRQQLQRLYATAFFDKKDLEAHLTKIEEAKKRDHRLLGKQLDLFTISPLVGSGLILWMPKGAIIRGELEGFIRSQLVQRGYQPVYTPNIGRVEMYETSGHFPYYRDSQFTPVFQQDGASVVDFLIRKLDPKDKSIAHDLTAKQERELVAAAEIMGFDGKYNFDSPPEDRMAALRKWIGGTERFLLKPMNCPHHIQIYKVLPRSYRELPLRLAEFGTVYRYEQTGELNGMTRVRGFTQDDAHIFCTEDQVAEEFRGCIEMTQFVLRSLGLDNYRVRLGFRDPASDKYVGSDASWNRAQGALVEVCQSLGIEASQEPGEAAFYGPKADFVVNDCLGREWQLGTVQLDYNLPSTERFALDYIGSDNHAHRPVMIHRAPLGSLERFIGVLIEHFAGAFPLWLAPEQVRVLSVSEKSEEYGRKVLAQFQAAGLRATGDFRAEKLGAKIRDAQLKLIPYMLVVGPKDEAAGTVAVRDRIDGDVGAMPVAQALAKLQDEIAQRLVRQKANLDTASGMGARGSGAEY